MGLEALARRLGSPQRHPAGSFFPAHPDSAYVHVVESRTDGSARPDSWLWHTDQSHRPDPARYTVLQAHLLPRHGGDTLFADTTAAHDQLPREWKALLDTAVGTHAHPLGSATAHHPVVTLVPETGRPSLYLNHHWAPHDILVWDNQRVMHRATPLAPGTRRVMHRVTSTRPTSSSA
ncbi:TauD/TfdA family dioxygenase [Streptomyces sp. NPDC048357]|uniref:TauD/TfdA dioxygenase family protein n=1 Tax=Streptomyces sp. NPDC048357 TaxID=3154719 RepID=UPI0034473869